MNVRNAGWIRLVGAALCLLALQTAGIRVKAESDTDPKTTTTSSTSPSNGGDNKTYSSTGLENTVLTGNGPYGPDNYTIAETVIRALNSRSDIDLFIGRETDTQYISLMGGVLHLVLERIQALRSKGQTFVITRESIRPYMSSVLRRIIEGIEPKFTGESALFDPPAPGQHVSDPRIRRAIMDIVLARGSDPNALRLPGILVNMLMSDKPDQLKKLAKNGPAFEQALKEYYEHLPVKQFGILGLAGRNVHASSFDRVNITVEPAGVDVLQGLDYSASVSFRSTLAIGGSISKDFSPARAGLISSIKEMYGIPDYIKHDPEKNARQAQINFQQNVKNVASQYRYMSTSTHYLVRADMDYVEDSTMGSGVIHRVRFAPGFTASHLFAVPVKAQSGTGIVHAPGIGFAGTVRPLLTLNPGTSARGNIVGSGMVWFQPLVPNYHLEHVVGDFPDDYQRYVFDHWYYRLGAEMSTRIGDDQTTPWRIFLQFRTLRRGDGRLSTIDILRRDTLISVGYGQTGNGLHLVSIRTDLVF